MSRVILYYAHPSHRHSVANQTMWATANTVDELTRVDLYAEYPRFNINIDREQDRLRAHDVVVFQCPLFWYSTPSLLKEWIDLVLELGFAYGDGGDALAGKVMMFALTAAGDETAYSTSGYQRYSLREFLTPLERTAGLSKMRFTSPYVLYGSINAREEPAVIRNHADNYRKLLRALISDNYQYDDADARGVVQAADIDALTRGV